MAVSAPLWRVKPDWRGETAVLVAPGWSLDAAQAATIAAARRAGASRVLAIGDAAFLFAPEDLDAVYHADGRWWQYHDRARALPCARITVSAHAAQVFGLKLLTHRSDLPFCDDPSQIATGGHDKRPWRNSGYQGINLAAHFWPARLVLAGFDMRLGPGGKRHFFGEHPNGVGKPSDYSKFAPAFADLVAPLRARDIAVLNATPGSALTVFPSADLPAVLARKAA